jgi:hypothetical protein
VTDETKLDPQVIGIVPADADETYWPEGFALTYAEDPTVREAHVYGPSEPPREAPNA